MDTADTALVRGVPDSFTAALRRHYDPVLDVDKARKQHHSYVDTLASAGYAIVEISSDEAQPDCVFVEDTAVVVGSTVVAARSGAPSRRGEVEPVLDALSSRFAVRAIEEPGTLDGGDVIVMGDMVLVGVTARTNEAGIEQLAKICAPLRREVRSIAVHDALHLKSVVLPLDEETLLVTPGSVDEQGLAGISAVYAEERDGCSALPLRDGRLLVTASAPRTADTLAELGYDVTSIDVSELLAADGGLTCLSILFEDPAS